MVNLVDRNTSQIIRSNPSEILHWVGLNNGQIPSPSSRFQMQDCLKLDS